MTRHLRAAGRVLAALILILLVALALFVLVERVVADEEASAAPGSAASLVRSYDTVS